MASHLPDRKATTENLRRLANAGILGHAGLERALLIAGIIPGRRAWMRFIDTLLLLLGTVFIAAGVIFFFAFNWAEMHTLSKLAIVQIALLCAVISGLYSGLDKPSGKASLLAASLLVGALLALYGQIYQTGADAYELFIGWAALISGWVLIGNFPPLWLLLLTLLEIGFILYWGQSFWLAFRSPLPYEILFLMNAGFIILWERFSSRGAAWLGGKWIPRLAAGAGLVFLVMPLIKLIFDSHYFRSAGVTVPLLPVLYFSTIVFMVWFYRFKKTDLFMMAAALLSVIVVITAFFSELIKNNYGGYFFLSIFIIGLSAGVAAWLRKLAKGQ